MAPKKNFKKNPAAKVVKKHKPRVDPAIEHITKQNEDNIEKELQTDLEKDLGELMENGNDEEELS